MPRRRDSRPRRHDLGASGSGKSDLALRLIDRGAVLVADDYTDVVRDGDALIAAAPATIAGRMEVRGIGVVDCPHRAHARVALAVTLGAEDRMPEPATITIAGVAVPNVTLAAAPASAPIKVELALAEATR